MGSEVVGANPQLTPAETGPTTHMASQNLRRGGSVFSDT
ncbi:hypothetical protein PA07A_1644 [Cutibacterium acnes P07A]|nr:hypothetical protein [Cutibacterium acnes P07A]